MLYTSCDEFQALKITARIFATKFIPFPSALVERRNSWARQYLTDFWNICTLKFFLAKILFRFIFQNWIMLVITNDADISLDKLSQNVILGNREIISWFPIKAYKGDCLCSKTFKSLISSALKRRVIWCSSNTRLANDCLIT